MANLIFSVILGYMADKIILKKYLNKEMVTKIWQIIAFGSMIAALGTMGFFTKKIEICLSIIIVGFGLNSAVNSGHLKSVLDLSQRSQSFTSLMVDLPSRHKTDFIHLAGAYKWNISLKELLY